MTTEIRDSNPWLTLAGIWTLSFIVNAYLIVPSSILPLYMADFSISHATAAWIVSGAFLSWSVTNLGIGVGIDRYGEYALIAVGSAVITLAGIWGYYAGLQNSFLSLLASRVVAGVAIGGIWTAGTNLVGRLFPPVRVGTALGLFTTSAPAGIALGQLFGPWIAASYGWPADFGFFGSASIAGFVFFVIPYTRTNPVNAPSSESGLGNIRTALASRSVRYGCAFGFTAYSLFLLFNSWLPAYLSQHFRVSLTSGAVVVAVFPVMGVVSRAAAGALSDRYLNHRRLPFVVISFLLTLPVIVVIAFVTNISILTDALVVAGFTIQLSIGILYSYVRDMVDEAVAGTALGLLTAASIFGAFTAPIIAGILIGSSGYLAAFAYASVLTAIALVLTWSAPTI